MKCPKCGMNALPDETISAVGFAYCKSCGMLWSAWAHAEIERLKQELADANEAARTSTKCLQEEEKDNDRLEHELATLKYTIVSTIGGVDYEGFPTSEINYLQRLRILLEKEQELATESERLAEAEKVIDGIAAAVTFNIGYPYIQLHDAKSFITAYRAKYPKGGGDE